jgi:hypothetical protein
MCLVCGGCETDVFLKTFEGTSIPCADNVTEEPCLFTQRPDRLWGPHCFPSYET